MFNNIKSNFYVKVLLYCLGVLFRCCPFRNVRGNERHFVSSQSYSPLIIILRNLSPTSAFSFYLVKSTWNVNYRSINELFKIGWEELISGDFQNIFRIGRRMALLNFMFEKTKKWKRKNRSERFKIHQKNMVRWIYGPRLVLEECTKCLTCRLVCFWLGFPAWI